MSEQERTFLSPPDVGELEREALLRAFDSGWIAPIGPELDAFEAELGEYVGIPGGVVALSSGTAALHLALLTHDVKPGDDVFCSTFTFAATANAIVYCGAEPVFIDSDLVSWNMNPNLLADALADARKRNRLPSAVVVVDLYGQCADYDEIVPQCLELGIPVIEDSAEALGATYKGRHAGTLGDCGVFSFNGNKIMTTSGGGAFVCEDSSKVEQVRYLATQARQPVLHYEHSDTGYNYRLSNLLAAIGRAQLSRLDEIIDQRLAVNAAYREILSHLEFMPVPGWSGWNAWLTCVLLGSIAERDAVIKALAAERIESRPLWKPMHIQPLFAHRRSRGGGVSASLFDTGLCLPSGRTLNLDRLGAIADLMSNASR